jgi:hypothetical protein
VAVIIIMRKRRIHNTAASQPRWRRVWASFRKLEAQAAAGKAASKKRSGGKMKGAPFLGAPAAPPKPPLAKEL